MKIRKYGLIFKRAKDVYRAGIKLGWFIPASTEHPKGRFETIKEARKQGKIWGSTIDVTDYKIIRIKDYWKYKKHMITFKELIRRGRK